MRPVFKGVRSPTRGHTITQLRSLKESGYHNADTGTELSAEEADRHLQQMEQSRADKVAAHHINRALRTMTRSRGRPYITGDVIFRTIHGHRVPFKKVSEPFL